MTFGRRLDSKGPIVPYDASWVIVEVLQAGNSYKKPMEVTEKEAWFDKENNEMVIQVNFSDPLAISRNYDQDTLIVRLVSPTSFVSDDGKNLGQTKMSTYIKRQLPKSEISY